MFLTRLLLPLLWPHVQPMSISKTARSYATNKMNSQYMRQNGIFGGFVPCERGTCTSQQYCEQSGGDAISYCFMPQMSSRGVCCSFKESCGQTTSENVALFRNPNYPEVNRQPVNCAFTMVPKQGACGIRVDFIQALFAPAVNNACPQDSVSILHATPHVSGYNVPFCGLIQGVSTLVAVSDQSKVQIVVTTQSPTALWNIQLVQINCSSVQPPVVEGCGIANAQYPTFTSKENILSQMNISTTFHSFPMFKQRRRHTSDTTLPLGISTGRIIGGLETPNMYPWVVALLLDMTLRCGGSLVTRQWVLTAGHCLAIPQTPDTPDIGRLSVMLGVHNLYMMQDMRQLARGISNIMRHPQYLSASNDIALLRLSQPIIYSVVIRPICLPPKADETYAHRMGIIAGWGLTGPNGTMQTSVLLSANVEILDNVQCNQLWNRNGVRIDDSMLCAGMGAPSTCGGDSGGPLAVQEQLDGFYSVAGITSFGAPPVCGNPTLPDVWTRVTSYLDWIHLVLVEI